MNKQKNNILAIDALRFISILAVVLIHTTSKGLESINYDLDRMPWALYLNQASRFAVPLLFMISGFVLELNYSLNENFWMYLKKRVNRIFVPYLFWSAIYYYLVYTEHAESLFQALLTGNASFQLYFIPAIIIMYLLFPLFHKGYKFLSQPLILTSLGIIEILILRQDYYIRHLTYPFPVSVTIFNIFIFILGMTASHYQEQLKKVLQKIKYLLIPLVFLFTGYLYWEGRNRYFKTYDIGAFYSQWRPSVLFYTITFAGLIYALFDKIKIKALIITQLSGLSYFVYFVHIIWLEIFWYQGVNMVIFFVLTAGMSFLSAYLIHKIPPLAKLTG